MREKFATLLQAERIDVATVMQNYERVYHSLAQWLNQQHEQGKGFIGINGAQGSGKSTLCKLLALLLEHEFGKSVAVLSLDDFYLTQAQRKDLARTVHPLLQTRGVPGTHDVVLAMNVLTALRRGLPVKLPRFDKALDDRCPQDAWQSIDQPVDMILFEGWCVGAVPQTDAQLKNPVNELELTEDAQGVWRQYVNARLGADYQELFAMLDVLIMLQVPCFEKVYEWRALQESGLQRKMRDEVLRRFIMHYERLTRHMLDELPQRADKVLRLGDDHQIAGGQI